MDIVSEYQDFINCVTNPWMSIFLFSDVDIIVDSFSTVLLHKVPYLFWDSVACNSAPRINFCVY